MNYILNFPYSYHKHNNTLFYLSTSIQNKTKHKSFPFYLKILSPIAICGISFIYIKRNFHNKLTDNFSSKINNYVHSILTSEEIENDGINLLNRIISHPKTKTAMMSLISNTLNDKLIFNSLVTYTNKIIIDILQDKKIQSLIQTNLQLSLQNTHLKQEFVGLVQYILNQERTKQITRNYFLEMFNKCDIQNSFTNLILQSTLRTMKHKETKSNFSNFIIETWADPNLRWNVLMKTFQFWKPNRKEAKH